jgi:hypothetical protein
MPKGKLQNHIAWCFQKLPDFSNNIDYDQYLNHLNDEMYNRGSTVQLQVTFDERVEQALYTVGCTGSTTCRWHKPPRNDPLLIWMGLCSDSHIKSTAG